MLQTAAERPDDAAPPPLLRVILVGRTGLEGSLRREHGIELVRARTPLDAVGEHGLPMPGTPERTLVVLSAEQARSDDAAELIRALRRVNSKVKVLAVRGPIAPGSGPQAPTDGLISGDADGAEVMSLMRQLEAPTPESAVIGVPTVAIDPGSTPAALGSSVVTTAPAAPTSPSVPLEDVTVLHSMLSGGDILPTCLEMAQRATPGGPVVFLAGGKGSRPESLPEGYNAVGVQHREQVFGWLSGPGGGSGDVVLRQRAVWLAHWLALREQHRQLCAAAFTDGLTGAWNRRYFERFLDGAIRDSHRKRQSLTILVFDIDDFKHYNDAYGHAAGDEILIETVRLMRAVVRPNDKVARIGGDEFAVIFHEPEGPREPGSRHPSEISQIARRFQSQIAGARFPKLGAEARGRLTISGGLATYPWDGHTVDTLLERADELALESKRLGKNVITYGPSMGEDGEGGTLLGS